MEASLAIPALPVTPLATPSTAVRGDRMAIQTGTERTGSISVPAHRCLHLLLNVAALKSFL